MPGTSYYTIYKKAVTEFKDPTLNKLLEQQSVLFFEVMYNFLENAIPLFTNPVDARKKIRDRNIPELFENTFVGDGVTSSFDVEHFPSDQKMENSIVEVLVNGVATNGTYDETLHKLNFQFPPESDDNVEFNIYYVGNFNKELNYDEEYILSQYIVSCWSEYITNDKLDIIRLLGDTDFKLPSNSTTTQAKTSWNIVNRETVQKRMNKYAWDSIRLGQKW